jgi:hypothetical protein
MSIGRGPGVSARLVAAHPGSFRVVSQAQKNTGRTGPGQSSSRLRSLAKERRRRCLQPCSSDDRPTDDGGPATKVAPFTTSYYPLHPFHYRTVPMILLLQIHEVLQINLVAGGPRACSISRKVRGVLLRLLVILRSLVRTSAQPPYPSLPNLGYFYLQL